LKKLDESSSLFKESTNLLMIEEENCFYKEITLGKPNIKAIIKTKKMRQL